MAGRAGSGDALDHSATRAALPPLSMLKLCGALRFRLGTWLAGLAVVFITPPGPPPVTCYSLAQPIDGHKADDNCTPGAGYIIKYMLCCNTGILPSPTCYWSKIQPDLFWFRYLQPTIYLLV